MTLPSWPSSTSQAFLQEANSSVSNAPRPAPFSAHFTLAQILDRVMDPTGQQRPLQGFLASGRGHTLEQALVFLPAADRQELGNRLGSSGLAPWISLSEESDVAIFHSDLYSLATPLRRGGHLQEAGIVLGFLSQSETGVSPALRMRAEGDLGALRGNGSSWGRRLEFLGDRFVEEAFHPATLAGMALGQLAFAPVRTFCLNRLFNPTTGRFLLGSLGSRAAAASLGTAVEVPVFWGTSKGVNEWLHPGRQNWDLRTNLTEMAGLALTLGILRTTGFTASSALNWANRPALQGGISVLTPGTRLLQTAFPPAATIGGLYLAHWAEEGLGFREAQDSGNRLLDSVVFYFQFGISGRIAHGFLGEGFHRWNQQMEANLARRVEGPPPWFPNLEGFSQSLSENLSAFLMPERGLVPAGIPEGWMAMTTRPESTGRPTVLAMSGLEGQETSPNRSGGAAQRIPEFLQRAKQSELSVLKDIVLAVYEEVTGRPPSESVQRYFEYTDPESWRSGINILSGGEETGERVRRALEANPQFLEFVRQWETRHHFIHVSEIPRVRERRLGHAAAITKHENALLKEMLRSPDVRGMREFIDSRRGFFRGKKKGELDIQSVQTPDGEKIYAGNVSRLGLIARFEDSGILQGPIYFRSQFTPETLAGTLARFEGGEGEALLAEMFAPPRFRNPQQVQVERLPETPVNYSTTRAIDKVQEIFAEHPDLEGIRQLLSGKNKNGPLLERGESDGSKTVVFNRGPVGWIIRFDPAGQIQLPLRVGRAFLPEEFADPTFFLKMSPQEVTPPPIPLNSPENPLWPRREENPTEYSMRFQSASQDFDNAAQLHLVRTMETLLTQEETSSFAREVIDRLKSLTREQKEGSGVLVREYSLPGLTEPLTILSPITTFLPENWSQFFAQQVRNEIQRDGQPVRRAVEIGTGTGWLSIYLRKLGLVEEMEGGDYTETAPVVSRINALINGVDGVRFVQSDLWENLSTEQPVDLVVACIPQIPRSIDGISQRGFADYAPERDNFMKPYGLGLIYDALRQSQPHISERGRILLNLAGRPRLENLNEMFRRTGFHPLVRNHDIIPQDPGTDISPLAALEGNFPGVRFQFLPPVGHESAEELSAREALNVPGIRHHQYLIEGRPYANYFREALRGPEGLRSAGRWGYTEDPGSENNELRNQLAQWMSREWGTAFPTDVLFIGPNHDALLAGLLKINTPEAGRVLWFGEETPERPRVQGAVGNRSHENFSGGLESLRQSIAGGEFQGVVLHLPRLSWNQGEILDQLLLTAAQKEVPLIFVEAFAPRDGAEGNAVLRRMATDPRVAANTVVLQPWDLRLGVTGLPLSVAVIPNSGLFDSLARYGEITYSRVSTPVQEVYQNVLSRLPAWETTIERGQLPLRGTLEPLLTVYSPPSQLKSSLEMRLAFGTSPTGEPKKPVIDMSFGESEWVAPIQLRSTWEALSRTDSMEGVYWETMQAVLRYVRDSRGVDYAPENAVLGSGVHPLLFSTLEALRATSDRPLHIWVPQGSYGLFYPTVEAARSRLKIAETLPTDDYLLKASALDGQLRLLHPAPHARPVLLLNSPTNPAGRYYPEAELQDIARVLRRHQGFLLWDDVFGMTHTKKIPFHRSSQWQVLREELGDRMVGFGGVSKEFAAGGLRLGWALTDNARLAGEIRGQVAAQPDRLGMAAAGEYLSQWQSLVGRHQNYLASQRRLLAEFLDSRSLPYHDAEGGFALLVDFTRFFNNRRQFPVGSGQRVVVTSENFHHLLYTEAGIRIKASEWSQTPGRYRFVYSIQNLEAALDRLKIFFRNAR